MLSSVPEPTNVIYGLSCECHPERGIRYVGQTTKTAKHRLHGHKYAAENGNRRAKKNDYNVPVHRWIRKHGAGNIHTRVLEVCESATSLDAREEFWIGEVGTLAPNGLNLRPGGNSSRGYKHTDAMREKMRNRVYTDETRKKMSKSAKLRGITPEVAAKVALANSGERNWHAGFTNERVAELKRRLWNGETVTALSAEYGYRMVTVSHINTGVSWARVPWPIGPRREPETSALRSLRATGREHSLESRAKQSASMKLASHTPAKLANYIRTRGEGNPQAKVTSADVVQMRLMRESGLTYGEIAEQYGICDTNVSSICRRKTWKNVA